MQQRDAIVRSHRVAQEALASLLRQQSAIEPLVHERLHAIRMSLDHIRPMTTAAGNHGKAPGTRLCVALASLPNGERRSTPRWPLIKPVTLTLDSLRLQATTLDIGAGGLLLAPMPLPGPDRIMAAVLELAPGDHVAGTLSIDREGFGHLAFETGTGALPGSLPRLLEACMTAYEPALREAAALAGDMARRMETLPEAVAALRNRHVPTAAEQPKPGARLEQALGPLLLDALQADPRIAYVAAVDRSGYIVDEIMRSNRASSRRTQQAVDAVTLRAARFAAEPIMQLHCRRPENAIATAFSDAAAPIIVGGRRWGCVQIGRTPLSFEA